MITLYQKGEWFFYELFFLCLLLQMFAFYEQVVS